MMGDEGIPDEVVVIGGALSPEECRALIDLSENVGYQPATIEGSLEGPYGFAVGEGRDNCRAAVDDAPLAAALWKRLARCVPPGFDGRGVVGLNERLRFYRYAPGQSFGAHTDGYYERGGARSLLTLIVYLNDDYAGGETVFLESGRVITPQTGAALIFPHRLWHAGRPVVSGRKYILRTDVMYESGPAGRDG